MTQIVPINSLCTTLKKTIDPHKHSGQELLHYSIPAFDQGFPTLEYGSEIQSNKLVIDRPCILFSRLNPRIRRVWDLSDLDTDYPLAIASTEFVPFVVRDNKKLHSRYLYWFFHTERFLTFARAGVQAATKSRERVNKDHLFEVEIPLPPLEDQRRIASILDKADAVRRKRKEAIALTEELLRSAFLEMFGDPVTNPKGWSTVPFSQLVQGEMRNGLSPSNKGTYRGQVLTLSAITQGTFNSAEKKTAEFDVPPPKNKMVRKSDLLVCRGNGNINLVGCAKFPDTDYNDVMFPDTIIGVPINSSLVNRNYLETLWNSSSVRRQIEQQARTTNGTQKINQKVLNNIQILLPPIALQEKFGAFCHPIKAVSVRFADSAPNNLFNSLLQRAFRGEL